MQALETVRRTVASIAQVPVPEDPAVSLFERGVIDSFGVIELVARLEEAFQITIPDADMIPSSFETLEKIASYVASRQG
jgi:acyl carrier protein